MNVVQTERRRSGVVADAGLPHAAGQFVANSGARQAALCALCSRQQYRGAGRLRSVHRHAPDPRPPSPRNRQPHGWRCVSFLLSEGTDGINQ